MPSSFPCGTRASCSKAEHNPPSGGRGPKRYVATAAIAAVFVLWTLVFLPWALLGTALLRLTTRGGPLSPTLQGRVRTWITAYGRGMIFLLRPFLPVRMVNARAATVAAPCVIIANHQSFLDLYLLGCQAEANLCLVSKSWPYRRLFFFAPVMRAAGYVDAESLPPHELEALCLTRLGQGASLVFFPEGRRTRDGQLGRFHAGAFLVACKAHVPVVPLIISNSFAAFPAGARAFTPTPLRLAMLDPMFPRTFAASSLPHRAMLRHARALFVQHLQPDIPT